MKNILIAFFFFQTAFLFAQKDSLNKLTFSGYTEIYYSYDFSNPQNNEKTNFIFNHKRHNDLNLNLAVVKANFINKKTRANFGLMLGNYARYNLNSEPNWAKFIYEANLGIKLSKKNNLWLDAGIMPSHIGFESAISADCWTLTRSILAENSPYYETGFKLNFTNKNEKLYLAFLVLNGWQRVKMIDNNKNPSFGFQLNYKPTEKIILNYSNFIGTTKADSLQSIRTYHNFFLQYEPKTKFAFIAGFDIGTDKYNLTNYGIWFSPVIIVRYTLNDKMKIACRGEYYNDKKQIIIPTNTLNGFQVSGISTNFDYKINEKIQLRVEGKIHNSKDIIFENNSNKNYSLTTNMTIKF